MSLSRIAGISGVAFFVLLAIATVVPGQPPDFDAGDDEVVEYVTDDTSGKELSNFLNLLALPAFGLLAVGLARAAAPELGEARTWATISLVGAAGGIASVGVASAVFGALVARADTLAETPATAGLLWDVSNSVFAVASLMGGVYLAGAGLAILAGRVLPAWLGWLAIAVSVPSVIGGAFPSDAIEMQGLGFLAFYGFLGFMLWNLAAGIVLIARSRPALPQAGDTS